MATFGMKGNNDPRFIHVQHDSGMSPGGSSRSVPYERFGADGRASLDQVASPQRAAVAAPDGLAVWVCQAWELREHGPGLFRKVTQNVPAEAMEAIQELPGPWQLICL